MKFNCRRDFKIFKAIVTSNGPTDGLTEKLVKCVKT